MESIFIIVIAAVAIALRAGFSHYKVKNAMKALESGTYDPQLDVARIGDHAVLTEKIHAGEEQRGRNNTVDLYIGRTTVRGILPSNIAFGWSPFDHSYDPPITDRNSLWLHLLFGIPLPARLVDGCSIYASRGDLVCETRISPSPYGSELVMDFAKVYLERQPLDLPHDLHALAVGPVQNIAPVALRTMLAFCPDASKTAEALRHAREADSRLLNMIAASRAFEEMAEQVREVASSAGANRHARVQAIRNILSHGSGPDVLGISAHPVPTEVAVAFLTKLRDLKHESAEPAILRYLEMEEARPAAIDALATCGGREAVMPLKKLLNRGRLSDDETIGAQVAIELIQDRLVGGARGGLALAAAAKDGGQLSVASGQKGELSTAAIEGVGAVSEPEDA